MEKIKGVPLSQVWDTMKLTQKLQLLVDLTGLQKRWLSVRFSHYGSLYYTGDVQPPIGNHYVKDGKVVKDSKFSMGPATGRDWIDAGRSNLEIDRGPCTLGLMTFFVQLLTSQKGYLSRSICTLSERERRMQPIL